MIWLANKSGARKKVHDVTHFHYRCGRSMGRDLVCR